MNTKKIEAIIINSKYELDSYVKRRNAYKALKTIKEEIKKELKVVAIEIREMKSGRKNVPNGYVLGLNSTSEQYRYKHIAYCIFFNGTKYEDIERKSYRSVAKYYYNRYLSNWWKLTEKIYKESCDDENVYISSE